jgi:hypothetical protein
LSEEFQSELEAETIFNCECGKMFIVKRDQRLILVHIRQCEKCVVNVDFHHFIYTRTGRSKVEIAKTKRSKKKKNNKKNKKKKSFEININNN